MISIQKRVGALVVMALLICLRPVFPQENLQRNQNYLVTNWGPDEGLPGNSVTDIAQTPEGYIWAGTLLSGLLRFDGVRFVSFSVKNIPRFRGISIRKLMVSSSGKMWASAYNGSLLNWDSSQGFTLIETNAGRMESLLWSQPGQAIFSMGNGRLYELSLASGSWKGKMIELPRSDFRQLPCADAEGGVWELLNQRAMVRWHDKRLERLTPPPGLGSHQLTALTSDQSGMIWAGADGAVLKWEGHRLEDATPANTTIGNVRFMVPAGSSLWVEDGAQLRRLLNGQWVAEASGWNDSFSKELWPKKYGDSRGGLWLANDETGLVHVLPDGTMHVINANTGLPSNAIGTIFVGRNGTAWIGYERGGLVEVRPRLFKVIGRTLGLKTVVNSVCEDAGGSIWIGTAGHTCVRFQDGRCVNYFLPSDTVPRDTVVVADAQNRVWASGRNCGLFLFTNGQFTPVFGPDKFSGGVHLFCPARDGRLWIGSLNDIFVMAGGDLRKVYSVRGSTARPTAIAETSDGTIWAGTTAGSLMRWNGSEFITLTSPELKSLDLGRFCSLCPTPDGGLWVGTSEGGVLRFQKGNFRRLSTQNGLHSDRISTVQLDPGGNLWLASDSGVERVAASTLERFERGDVEAVTASQYGRDDGIENIAGSIEFQPNCWQGRNGTLWFAMGNSIAYVDTGQVNANSLPPMTVLEELRMDQKVVWPANTGMISPANEMASDEEISRNTSKVVIPPGAHDLEFRYTGLSRSKSPLLQFKYRLAGIDPDWHYANHDRTAQYNYLPPGNYVFQVKAGNSDDVWEETCAALDVELQPYFYQAAWFRWVAGIGLVTSVGLVIWNVSRRRIRRKLERLAELNEMERDRVRIARDMHDEIGSKLARISYISELVRESEGQAQPVSDQINAIAETSRDVLQSLDEIVWAVNPHNDNLQHLAAYLSNYAHDYFQSTSVSCAVKMPMNLPQHPVAAETRHNLFLAFEESLTNVLKHSAAKSVTIQMDLGPEYFEVLIIDDGHGLNKGARNPKASASQTADGLLNMQSRLTAVGGKWTIEDAPGHGVKVSLTIPLKHPTKKDL